MSNFKRVSSDVSFLLNSAVASGTLRSIVVEEEKKDFLMRCPVHIVLISPVGQAKSTIMQQVSAQIGRPVITEISRAGLVGTLDTKVLQVIPGAAWESRNSLLLLDEFAFTRRKEGWEVFLQLLEGQQYSRRIGLFSTHQLLKEDDLYFEVDKGMMDLKTRFSCIAATMKKLEFQRGQNFRAFMSRCVPFSFELGMDDLEKISEGHELFVKKEMSPEKNVVIPAKKYKRIRKVVMKELEKCEDLNVRKELYLRSIGDCCRIYAANGKNDIDFFEKITAWKVSAHMLIGKYFRGK